MRIFLSYRRDDAAGQAGRLHDALAARFGDGSIFQDVSTIRPGEDFTVVLSEAIDACDVMLVVIGPRWATALGSEQRPRLHDPGDYVRLEVATALARGKRVIPVTVGEAALPAADSLPDDVQPIRTRQAIELRDTSWHADLESLVDSLTGKRRQPARVPARVWILTFVGVLAAAVTLAIWQPWSRDSMSGTTDAPPSCSPRLDSDPAWTARRLVEEPRGLTDESLVAAQEAGYRRLGPDRWGLQARVMMTNQKTDDFAYNSYWRYDGMTVDGVFYPLSCFTPLVGGELLDPGLSSEALIGIETPTEPRGQIEIVAGPRILISNP